MRNKLLILLLALSALLGGCAGIAEMKQTGEPLQNGAICTLEVLK